jgi:molybdate transport system substrate-binding protein
MIKRVISLLFVITLCLSACVPAGRSAPNGPITLTVFAASSLTDAFTEIGSAFSANQPNIKVEFNFAGSQQLRQQLEQGAVGDVFASANAREMNTAIGSGLIVSGTQQTFLHNRLIVILPKNNPANIQSLQDLAKPKLKIVLAAPAVPVGGYALTALDKMNAEFGATFSATVVSNVVSYEDNVKQVVAKIQLGEGDAGIVYSSDVTPSAAPQISTIEIPDKFNVLATYPIAVLKAAPHSQLAAVFVDYVLSDKGQSILKKWNFLPK